MKRFLTFGVLTSILLFNQLVHSQINSKTTTHIILDEEYSDWDTYSNIGESNVLKAANDNDFLFIYFELDNPISIQNSNSLTLYIDADNNPATGISVNGIGAEIEFTFGTKSGTAYLGGNSYSIGASDLFLVTSPTVWSDIFELSIDRNAIISSNTVFTSNTIKILLKDLDSGDLNPATSGGAEYIFVSNTFDPLQYSLNKKSGDHLRIVSHNVEFDGFFEDPQKPSFQRMYQAIVPDIIGFQEIYDHNATDMTTRLEEILPSPDGKEWKASNYADTWVASRYDILSTHSVGGFGNGAFLLDLRPDYNTNLLLISAHPPCCDNDVSRQNEVDAIAQFIRDAKAGTGSITLADSTPVVILGDMNFVGDTLQLITLLDGDINDESTYGEDYIPDWDTTSFEDSKPQVTNLPMTFTQGNSTGAGSYAKGRLDYIIYSGSVMDLQNSFVLYTHSLPSDTLTKYSLQENDTESASDHFPVVADFYINLNIPNNDTIEEYGILPLRENDINGNPIHLNQTKTISGIVTMSNELGTTGPAYIQDNEAGIAVYGSDFVSLLSSGDSITLTGDVGFYNGLTEMVYNAASSSVTVHKNMSIPNPEIVPIDSVLNQEWDGNELLEGKLLRINNVKFSETGTFASNANYTLTDGTNTLTVRIDGDTDIDGTEIPSDTISIIGCISQYDSSSPYSEGYQIFPRSLSDIIEGSTPNPTITLIQPTEGTILTGNTNFNIEWTSSNVSNIDLYYKLWDESTWTEIATSVNATNNSYTWTVPAIENDSCQIKAVKSDEETVYDISDK
ncbi:MAG: endonuclease/exonuclease/phosphatase family protein, partial [Bacteroidales bacterium]|nr:endonuclease/exonuclease/phosphatase family protein [Bacteroidales bacterium]